MVAVLIKKKLQWSTKYVIMIRRLHKYLAFFFWIFSLIVISGGTIFFVNNHLENPEHYHFIILTNIVLMFALTTVLEINF